MVTVKKDSRKKEFKQQGPKEVNIKDARFGIRRLFLNSQERPRVAQYMEPGRGNWTSR
jgi:hypothetical protein